MTTEEEEELLLSGQDVTRRALGVLCCARAPLHLLSGTASRVQLFLNTRSRGRFRPYFVRWNIIRIFGSAKQWSLGAALKDEMVWQKRARLVAAHPSSAKFAL